MLSSRGNALQPNESFKSVGDHCKYSKNCMTSLILRFLGELFRTRGPRKATQEFASTKGFDYVEQLDPIQLDLYATSFFGRFDAARNVITGVVDATRFTYFDHDRASGRGENSLMRSVVVFETNSKAEDCGPKHASDGWMSEKSGSHLF